MSKETSLFSIHRKIQLARFESSSSRVLSTNHNAQQFISTNQSITMLDRLLQPITMLDSLLQPITMLDRLFQPVTMQYFNQSQISVRCKHSQLACGFGRRIYKWKSMAKIIVPFQGVLARIAGLQVVVDTL
jgi:hypothetical protein